MIEPFTLAMPEAQLADLSRRLAATRWPDKETVDDGSQGVPLARVQELCAHWRDRYDWRRCEVMLNGFGQFRTDIDGLGIHFLHIRSPRPDALPLLMTHGWPGSVIEFHKVIGPLTDPEAHGGNGRDAFHLVLPSLPGYGFSDKPRGTGCGIGAVAAMWRTLMQRLGYDRYVAQGGDWGSAVTTALAMIAPPELAAIHLNMVVAPPDLPQRADWTSQEQAIASDLDRFAKDGTGYSLQQRTGPQTLGYGLSDSPVGQAAWIYDKLAAWSDCDGDPLSVFGLDEIIDNIMLYWLPGTATSSARLYWESLGRAADPRIVGVPTGCSIFRKEIYRTSRRWAERSYRNIVYWNEPEKGGHFAAFEQPELFVRELRDAFRAFR